jgi:cytochrome c553
MKTDGIFSAAIVISWLVGCNGAYAADTAAGQRIFEGTCATCHGLQGYVGKSSAELEVTLKGMVAGTIDHPKKLALSDTDVRNLAAYMSSSREAN